MKLSEAFSFCEAIIEKNSRSFYMAFKDLPTRKREALYAVYAFCRMGDDLIDLDHNLQALEAMRERLLNLNHTQPEEPVWVAIQEAIYRYQIPLQPFLDQFDGQRLDANFNGIANLQALLDYAYLVASTVGQMLLPILATHNHLKLNQFAIDLGQAMQITNILRDVGEDADRGRIYLPQDALNVEIRKALQTKKVNAAFIELWEKLAAIAEQRYAQCLTQIHHFDRDSQKALIQAIFFYRAILDAVRQADYNCLTQRPYVRNFEILKQQIQQFIQQGAFVWIPIS